MKGTSNRFKRSAADTADVVRPVPKQRLLIERRKVFTEAIPRTTSASRLEIIDQDRDIEGRMGVDIC